MALQKHLTISAWVYQGGLRASHFELMIFTENNTPKAHIGIFELIILQKSVLLRHI
jgi:hypothetical protein